MAKVHDPEPVWDKPPPVSEEWITFIDENVLRELPSTKVRGIHRHGSSYWTRTARIELEQQSDTESTTYFLKVTKDEIGKAMVSGEYISMKTLHDTIPNLTPKPIAWGTYASSPDIHFFLCEFVEMGETLPDVHDLMEGLAGLHKKGLSPNGKYGFAVPTVQGRVPQYTMWTSSWEEFFSHSIRCVMDNEQESQGSDREMQELCQAILDKVVPRLLRPLETGGRSIQPCLIHGDIWDGNVSSSKDNKQSFIFDATCIYAHNEMELAPLRPSRHRMSTEPYIKTYFNYSDASAPEEDQDDRNALYCLRWDLNCSTLYPGNLRFRKICLDVMRSLVAKHSGGYEGWARERGEEIVPRLGLESS